MLTNVIKKLKSNIFTDKQSAFTLAEVVIAIVVLGVIASTLTGVVYFSRKDINHKDLVATLQSQVIKLNRSYKIALAENDDLDRWVYKNPKDNSVEKMRSVTQAKQNEMFAKVWESYFPSTKVCGAGTTDTCFPKSTVSGQSSVNYNAKSDYYKMRTGDGASIAIKISDHMCRGTGVNGRDKGVCGEIIIDINGNKGPNKEGLDTYRLGIFHNGIRPFTGGCGDPLNSANVVLTTGETCYEDFNVTTCPKDKPYKCHNCDGKIVCVADEKACSALQKAGGCAPETCPSGTISYYVDGNIQCIPEDQKNCYEQIKLNPEYKWDPVTKKCLSPKENCEKNGGYWEAGKEICWDSPEHMCTTKQQVYIPKPNQTPNFECISQEEYCKREVRKDGTGGLGGWLWKNNVCCTATSVAANVNATCCNAYSDVKGGSHSWWDGTSACCTSNTTEACCKSTEDGHEAGFWANGKCWKDPKTQCEKPAPEGLGGIWISSTNSCCTTKIVDNTSNPKYCFASEKDKCNAPSDKGGKGGWYVASADKCCTSETDAKVCCKGIWRTYNGNNYCYENEKAVCVAPTANAGIGGWWVPEATTGYNTYSGCCTSEGTRVCCNGLDKNHWWAESTKSCCQGPIEATKSCCESAENGHESKYWTSTPSQCWTSASQFCITATSSNGLGGWNWIGDAKSGVCCTDTSKTTRSNDSGNGNIQHQGQFDRLLTDDYSKRCCINESTLNGHSRFIWYTNNYKGNSGYCWDTINNLCQQQTDTSDDHGLGGWYWDGTDCCSINTTADTIKYWTKGNIKANPPTLESTVNVSVKNESDRSTKSCCTNVNGKGNHTRYNWTDKNYAGKGGYCWFDDEELCQKQTDSGNDNGMGGWYWDKASNHCCTSEYDVNVNTNNKSQTVFRKGATSAQVLAYNQRNDSNKACCTNSNTKGKHTRFIWTAKAYADTRGYCWLDNNELCQDQTDNNTYNHDAGMGGWFWDSANNVCCTIRTTAAQDINVKGGSASKVNVNNQSNNSNKNCCTNTNTKGDHTRFNWTDKTYANNGGYCWLNDAELCQSQTGLNDHGMGGWYWDSATSMCCTSKYDTSITTAPKSQEVFRKGATSAQVKVYNQQNASNKACCTNSNAKGGHTRFNWTDKNYAGNGGYCWLDDSELCQTQTDKASTYGKDFGMGGWAWDSSSNRCCTSKYDTNIKSSNSTQKKYTKGGSSATVSAYNQQNDSNKFCCTNSNTKGGHTRFNWTANNYASSGGYCWLNDEELCQSQTDASRIYGKDYGMGGWLWDNASNSCCTIKTTSNQPVFRKGGSSASVVVKNESGNSNKNCCTNSNTKGGHTRFNWTDSTNVSGSKGYCWLNDSELCTDQTNGMGGWFWDSSASRCCTIKYDTSITTAPKSQTVYRKGASSATVTIYNQQNASNKACCTNSNTAGGHTRFNWTDNNYAGSGGYCWNDDSELCQTQTDKASTYGKDHGMGGWAWDSSANTCCTIKTTSAQTKYVKGGSSATVAVKNQQASSSKFCCTNSNTKGGHTRFNWIDNNYASKGGYCWLNDAELCQDQTDSSNDHGMGGWLWDSSANVCCTIKTTSSQTKYVKGGSSASVNVKNQSSSSNKACCTSTQTKGGHTRFNWTDNNYAGKGGYCWLDDAELCQSQTGLVDHGMGGWLWDSTNNVCCTVKTTSAQTKYVKGGSSARVNVKNQSNDSTRQCCTSTQTKGGHINTFWSSTTSKDNAGYCWNSKADFCKSTLSAGLKGWDYDSTNNQCCTNDTTTNSSYWNTHYYSAMTKKDQGSYSTEYCCTSTSTSNGHTNFNWINGKCWNSNSGFCTDTIANKGANGWYQDGSNCCTNSKTGTETVKGKGGTTSTITYKNNSDNSTAECCRKRGSNTRAYWLNSYCWSTLDEYCKSTNSSGARGYYSYTSSGTNYCCTNNKSGSLSGKNNGSSYSVTYKGNSAGAQTTKECCVNATSGAKTYINNRCWNNLNGYCTTSSSSGGAGGYYQYGSNCCVASGSESSVTTYGGSSASSSSTLYIKNENSTKTCCHNKTGTTWYSTSSETGGTCCTNDNGSKACCESSQNGHTAGTWSESAKTCCFDADVSEACCKAIKGSDAYMAGGKCCASKDQSASCCQGFCGDAYSYKNNSCTCVTCEDGEYIPEDSSGNVLAAKCCTSKNDDETCCTAANAPGNGSGNNFYATTMCCASGNTSAECCAKYASNSGKSRFGYYDSHCTLLDSNQIYVCAVFNTSKFSSVAVGSTAVIRSSGGCTGISGTSADVVITGAGTGVSNRYGGTNVSGNGCSFIDSPQDSPYNGAGKVSWSSSTANGNYTCVLSPYGDDCSGWYESSSSNTCCTSDNTSACCASSLNPSGSGTWVTSGSVCCYDATISDACCKAMNNSNYYLEGSTCCASGNSSSACCTSSSNPKGAGKKYVASGSVCCYSESDSDACCKAIKGSSYSLYGSTCSTEEPCSGWLTGSTCCTSESTKICCEASNNPDGAGTWVNDTSTAYYDPQNTLIALNIPDAVKMNGKVLNYTPAPIFAQPAYASSSSEKDITVAVQGDGTLTEGKIFAGTTTFCDFSNSSSGAICTVPINALHSSGGLQVRISCTHGNGNKNIECYSGCSYSQTISSGNTIVGKITSLGDEHSNTVLITCGSTSSGGSSSGSSGSGSSSPSVDFNFSIADSTGFEGYYTYSEDCNLRSTDGTTKSCDFFADKTYYVQLNCKDGYTASLSSSGCTLDFNAVGPIPISTDPKTVNPSLTTGSAGSTCNVTGKCTASSSGGSGGSTAGTCCHDKNASSKCCLGMSNNSYWYNGSCSTVSSGFDVRVEYGSSISKVTVAGTSVANKGVKNVSSASGTSIVATPASGNTFNQWEVVDGGCTITSATSASTTISGATSGSKYCVIKPTTTAQETKEFSVALVSPTTASTLYNIVLYNSSNNEILNLNNGTVSASSVPSGEYTLRIGTFSFGTAGANLTNSGNANLSATVSGNCTIGDKQYSSNSSSDIGSKWTVTLPNSGDKSCNITVNVGEPPSGGGGSSGCTGTYTMTAKTPDKYTFAPYGYSGTSQYKLYAKYSASSVLIDTKNEIYEGKRTGISCGTATTSVEFSYTYPDTSTGAQNYLEISGPCKFVAVGSSSTSFAGQVEVTSPNAGDVTCTFTPKNCGSICSWVGTNGKCCASENSKECCEGASRVIPAYSCTHQKGTWASSSSTCCHSANVSYNCCKAIMGESATWNGSSCSGGSSGGGTNPILSYGIVVTPNNGITSITVDGNKVTTGGTSLTIKSSSPTVNISAEVKGGYSFDKWSATQGCNFSSGSSISTPTKLTFAQVNDKSSLSYKPCILNAYAKDSCDGWLVGSTCCTADSTQTCCEASNNPDGAGAWATDTCCHDKNASDKCCLAMSDDNYWYDGSCYTVSSGIDIYAEYGSDISGVTIAGTGVSNRNKVHVDNGAGTAIVATPVSGNTFSSWYSTNCTITSATSASTTIASVTSGAKFCIVEPKAVESETNEFTISIDTSGIVSTDKYSYCINSPDDDNMDRYCNDNSLLYAIEGDSSVNLPAGTYKFVVASKGNVDSSSEVYFGDNLTATATGDCTITPDGKYSFNGKHYYKKWTVTSTGACTIKPRSNVAISDTTIVIGDEKCTAVSYAKTYMGDTKKSCNTTGNTVGLNNPPRQFTLEHGKTTVLCCLVTENNAIRYYDYDAPDGGLSSYPEKSEKSDGNDGVMLTAKCYKAGGCTVNVDIRRDVTYKPRTKIINGGSQGLYSFGISQIPKGETKAVDIRVENGYKIKSVYTASSCEGLTITKTYLSQDPPVFEAKSTCSKNEATNISDATCECEVYAQTEVLPTDKKTTITFDGDSNMNFSPNTKPYTVDIPFGNSTTFATSCPVNYIFKGWSCTGEGYKFQTDDGVSNTFVNVKATDCGKTTCTASCYGKCEYCSGWVSATAINGKCCTAEDSEDCCQTNITNNAGHTAGTWDATNNVCCHSATSSDACCKAISGSDYSLSGGNCKKGNTTGNWFFNWTIKDTSNFKKFIISTKYVTDYSADGGCSAGSSPASGSCALDTNVPKIVAACKNTTSPVISIDRNDFKTYFDDTVYADGVTTNYLSISPITDSSDPNYSTSSSMVVNITMDCLECQNAYFTVSTDTADNFEYFEDASGNSFFDECKTGSGNKCIASGGAASFDIGCKSGTVPAITVPSGSADYELFSPEEETSEGNLYFVRSCQNVYEAKIDCLAVTEDEWNDGGCTVSGSASVQLSSSAPSSCSFSVGGSTISSSAITIPSGTLTMTCSRGAYVPTISGACCSLTNCSVGSTTVTCNTSWGSNSDCLLSAESCAAGWVGNAGGCCYSDNSKSCCEAPSQSSSSISHTQGTWAEASNNCCFSANTSSECCKAINGSSAVYDAVNKRCK